MGKPGQQPDKRLSEDEKDRIVELKLARFTTRQVAAQVGCSPQSVTLWWHRWLDDTQEERRAHLERHRSAAIAQAESLIAEARRALIRARAEPDLEPHARALAEVRFMAQERQSLRLLSQIAGFDAPIRIAATFDSMSDDEAAAILAQLDDDDDPAGDDGG